MEIKDLNGKLLKTIDKTHYVNVVFCNINLYGANVSGVDLSGVILIAIN